MAQENESQIVSHHNGVQYCEFRIGDDYFAINVLKVQELIRPHRVTVIPKAPSYIKGLINLRGQIVTSLSLRTMFGLEEKESEDSMNIIVQNGEDMYAISVDEILDVMELGSETFEETPDNIDDNVKRFISGVHKLKNKLIIVLDLDKVLMTEVEQ